MLTEITTTYKVEVYEGRDVWTFLLGASSAANAVIEAMNKAKAMEVEVTATTVKEAE